MLDLAVSKSSGSNCWERSLKIRIMWLKTTSHDILMMKVTGEHSTWYQPSCLVIASFKKIKPAFLLEWPFILKTVPHYLTKAGLRLLDSSDTHASSWAAGWPLKRFFWCWARKVAQGLRALAVLAQDLGFGSWHPHGSYRLPVAPGPGDLIASSELCVWCT